MLQSFDLKNKTSLGTNLTHLIQKGIKEKLDEFISSELDDVGEISPQTWKIVAHNITKTVKDSPAMVALLENVQNSLYATVENYISNIENEPISDLPRAQSILYRHANHEAWYQGVYDMPQYEQLAVDTSQQRPLKVRKQAFNMFNQSVLHEIMSNDKWPQIRRNLKENLCEENFEVFNQCLKIHAKLMQSASHVCVKEGFINLVEGLHLYYSKMYHDSLPNFKNGIDLNNPTHHHLSQISYLILEATKEMPKNWLRYGERRVVEIVGVFVTLLAMHTYDNGFNLPRDILYPFHILSVLDPEANWCTQWTHGAFGQHIFLNTLSQNSTLIQYLVEEVVCFLGLHQNDQPENVYQNGLSGQTVEYATFTHSVMILSKIVCYDKGRQFFPVTLRATEEAVSLENVILKMITYLNLKSNYKDSECTIPVASEIILTFIKKVLQNGDDGISDNFIKAIIEPIHNENVQPKKCFTVPQHCIEILVELTSSNNGIYYLLGSRQKHKIPIANIYRNQSSTNTSAVGMRKNRTLSISLERQYSARPIRIPSSSNTNTFIAAKVIENVTTILMRSQDMSNLNVLLPLIDICAKLFNIHEGLSMLDATNSQLIMAAISLYKQLSSESETARYYSVFKQPFSSRTKNYNIQSETLYEYLASFLTSVASVPCGLYVLAQEDAILQDLLTTLLQSSHVPWENPDFRLVVSMMTTVPQGVLALAGESQRILATSLCNVWCEYEDPVALMTGSDRKQIEATQHFINIIYTFVPNLEGVMALFSEPESSSEATLVDALPGPTNLSELLTFEDVEEPWHFVSLLVLRALVTNMDVSLYLNNTIKFQEKLLMLQSQNVAYDEETTETEESNTKSNSANKSIIIDQCSMLRHQILIASYTVGGHTERSIPSVFIDSEELGEDVEPNLCCILPPPNLTSTRSTARKMRSTRLKGQTDFQRFLQDTKQGLHDANWLSHARRAYRTSRSDDIKAYVILDLLEQVAKLSSAHDSSYLNALWLESDCDTLFSEESLGIQIAIRYGVANHLLQENPQNEDNLAQLLHLSHRLHKQRESETFHGFDWFVATVFLLCGGNMDRCRSCIGNISSLPVAQFLWPALDTDNSRSPLSQRAVMFGHILELLVKMELPLAFSALQVNGASWWLICRQWMVQCFWNVLDWPQICHWLVVSILNQPDFMLYFCVSLLRHKQPQILQATSEGNLWEQLMFTPMEGYQVGDQLSYMEKLAKRYRTCVLHHLLASSKNSST